MDLSMMGAGKTYTTTWYALNQKIPHVVIICPVSVAPKWGYMKTEFGLPVDSIISYQSIRSVKNKQPKHGLLNRRDFTRTIKHFNKKTYENEDVKIDSVEFSPTPSFVSKCAEGCLVVIDEFQHVKNLSAQFEAIRAIVRHILTTKSSSRVLFLSGSPFDKEEQTLRFFKLLNVFTEDSIASYNPYTYEMEWKGLAEIETYAREMDRITANSISRPRAFDSGKKLEHYAYELFQKVVKPRVSSSMLTPKTEAILHKHNGFFNILDEDELECLERGILKLRAIVEGESDIHITKVGGGATFGAITKALQLIEAGKKSMLVRKAREVLESHPTSKVILCVNYTATLEFLEKALEEFEPLILNGSVPSHRRGQIIHAFQAPTDKYRVLIGNVSVCSTGIDLDDKHGMFPRTAYISPNYSTITLYQLGHRFVRADSKNSANVYFAYGKDAVEMSLLESLARKSETMKETTPDQVDRGVIFPVDLPTFTEED